MLTDTATDLYTRGTVFASTSRGQPREPGLTVHFIDNTTHLLTQRPFRRVTVVEDYLVRTKRADARDILAATRTRSDHRLLATAHRRTSLVPETASFESN